MSLSADQRGRLSAAGTSGVSDAMERLALRRAVIVGFSCAAPGAMAAVGPALTVRQVPKHATSRREDRLVRHGEVGAGLARPGDFVVLDADGRTDVANWGENHARRCRDRGVAGVLVNGAARDVAGLRRLGLPVFHLGASPVSSRWDQETAEIGGVVTVAGTQIRAGDVIVGDEDGLVVIAPDLLPRVLEEMRP